jgi:hypothetical protein
VEGSSCDPKKFCTLLERVLRYDGSYTTSMHCQGNKKASSLSDLKTAASDSMISIVSVIFVISLVHCVDFLIVLLLRGPLAAYASDYTQMDHHSELLHGDLLHSFDVTDSIKESIDDLDVLDVQDDVPGIAKMFYVTPEALIMLLLDGLQSLSSRWTFVCTLEVPNEHGIQLVPSVDRSHRQIEKP